LKYCPRCGTNLAVVSDALAGRSSDPSQLDERMVKVFKDYYRGRNGVIIGAVVTAVATFKIVLFSLVPFAAAGGGILSTLTTIMFIYGIIALFFGAGLWSNSSSEIKAIERAASKGPLLHPKEDRVGRLTTGRLSSAPGSITAEALSNDQINSPGSVTEQTTRELEERTYQPTQERQSKQTQ
jgi:hypothetical protein